jgi:PAS domain S-box-containing protein
MAGKVPQGAVVGAHEEYLGACLEAAFDCVLMADASGGRVVDFNPAAARSFRYTREEVLGRTLAEPIVPPSLRESHSQGDVGNAGASCTAQMEVWT